MEDLTENIRNALRYIEANLDEDLPLCDIARQAYLSPFYFQRVFGALCGISVGEYIRRRRLTLAAEALTSSDARVIDIAAKYGYDSPVSFARAFQSFHGFNPSQASKSDATLKVFPRLVYQICVKEVIDVMNKDKIIICEKEYEASYLGESDMSSWSSSFSKRKYWRLENAYDDFRDKLRVEQVLPYNNYPPVNIEIGQIFVIDYYRFDQSVERRYYISDGTIWQNMPCTREFILDYLKPIRTDKMYVGEKEYSASYFGEQDMTYWSDYAIKREFWRLEDTGGIFEKCEMKRQVLPYNNYPPIKIDIGQVFVIDYHTKDGGIDRKYYIADGTVWQDMPSTRQFIIKE